MYTSRQIANYFIKKSFDTGCELTPMKLLKLCYIAHGWSLGLTGQPLLSEAIEAWKYGPVISNVYNDFKSYGSGQITELKEEYDYHNHQSYYPMVDQNAVPLLDKIWEVYGKYDGVYLSSLTHQQGTPWDIVWNHQGGKNRQSVVIPNNVIESHYKALATPNNYAAN